MHADADHRPPPGIATPPQRADTGTEFTTGMRLGWTPGVALRAERFVLGGSPWRLGEIPAPHRSFARRVFAAERAGVSVRTATEQRAAVYLLDRGIADPLPEPQPDVSDVEVVVPVYRHVAALERCLTALDLGGLPVTVVDDASPRGDASRIAEIARRHGARLIVRTHNGGPGAARTTGYAAGTQPFVAFVDADVAPSADWVQRLRPFFADPVVAAVGPRVLPEVTGASPIELYEQTRSELDMGSAPSRVVAGVPAGWLPSAAMMVRRSAILGAPFEAGLRIGEDVDLIWRLDEAGWTVRYVPEVVCLHQVRNSLREFSARRAGYGSSAADLERRHPRRLIPAQPTFHGLAVLAALATRRPWLAAGVTALEFARQLRVLGSRVPASVAAEMTGRTILSDWHWTGHVLRRDWWPVGLLVALASTRSKIARGLLGAMAWEPVRDHLLSPTRLGPARSLALRALDDTSYGTGVIRNAFRRRVFNVVAPRVTFASWRPAARRPG